MSEHTTRNGYDDVAAQTLSGELAAAKARRRSEEGEN